MWPSTTSKADTSPCSTCWRRDVAASCSPGARHPSARWRTDSTERGARSPRCRTRPSRSPRPTSSRCSRGASVGEDLARRDASERPDGVFCANDLLAVGVLQGAGILGSLRVPEDLALIGYDDIDFAQSTVVPLSSIRQPAREIGAAAVDALFATLSDPDAAPQRIRFRPELVVRASTGG
ncbi:substrate-binding domain-containing protein [Microbacterium sp. SORGH_AS_0505]|uniref:substrate-binding domain-containing protein n=1 Tax=Microbacterium sp. SORGH_AS_0505 TaxID=3041770 RepID=UPI0027D82634|nr:substrate-binding domain-containing protein [Microbacterium sp. SORGH_AS_0505]